MSSLLQRAKGVRDFLPEQKIIRDQVGKTIIEVFELFGYNPMQSPVIERYELFASKYSAGEASDMVQEGFVLTDRAKRELILRPEFTAPLARVFAMNKNIKLPFKVYQTGPNFRDGPLKLGRYREFFQYDADVIGSDDVMADAEMIAMAQEVFKRLGLEVVIQINSREILQAMIQQAGIAPELETDTIIAIDKYEKIGADGVTKELTDRGVSAQSSQALLSYLEVSGEDDMAVLAALEKILDNTTGIERLKTIFEVLTSLDSIRFVPSLARGQGYYTGTIYEVVLADQSKLASSIAGGGRYDRMIGEFLGEDTVYPAIGLSFGLDTIIDAMEVHDLITPQKNVAHCYAFAMDEAYRKELVVVVRELQAAGIKVDLQYGNKPFKKALEYANAYAIPYVLILGEDESKADSIMVKDMEKGSQELVKQIELVKYLQR